MKNIHILPTEKPSRLLVRNDKPFVLMLKEHSPFATNETHTYQHIYITNDDKIKEGDWALDLCEDLGLKYQPFKVDKATLKYANQECKKIILTTDVDLIKDSVQAIDETFLEWFVKNPSCESVAVKQELGFCINCEWNYDSCPNSEECLKGKYNIIIPKEEPKQTVEQYEQQGLEKYAYEFQQENCCTPIGQIKRYMNCVGCDRKPKQETLEEAYQRGYERGLNALLPLIENLEKQITEFKKNLYIR
jgi:hypothetical protein